MNKNSLKKLIECRYRSILTKSIALLSSSSSTSSYGRPVVSLTNKLNRTYFPMEPGIVTPRRSVPSHIQYPEYAISGID